MSKKNRRAPRRVTRVEETSLQSASSAAASTTGARPVTAFRGQPAKADLNQEYRYVFADLRKIGVIGAAMFALLFALAFVLK